VSLEGKRVVVTRARDQARRLSDLLTERGARVLFVPTIEIAPPYSWAEVDDSIRQLAEGRFDWVAFTSRNGVQSFFARLGCLPADVFKSAEIAAVGSSTGALLVEHGVQPDLVPQRFTAADLAAALGAGDGRRILLPRAETVPPDVVEALRAGGWDTHEVTAYRTVAATPEGPDADAVRAGDFDVVTLTSASTARGFAAAFSTSALGLGTEDARGRLVAAIGPVTAAACREEGMRVDVMPDEHTVPGLVAALENPP
jgi:uroporphyrinogen-III synthase